MTSTFLLGDVYNFNSLVIGLFGIVGIAGIFTAPLVGRLVDRMLPWTATLVGMTILLGCQALWTGAAAKSWGAVVVIILGESTPTARCSTVFNSTARCSS